MRNDILTYYIPFNMCFSQDSYQMFDSRNCKFNFDVKANGICHNYGNDWEKVNQISDLWRPKIPRDHIRENELNFLVKFTITRCDEPSIRSKFNNPFIRYREILENYATILQNPTPDFTFVIKGEEFKVHKKFLADASPYFSRLFVTNMKEARDNLSNDDNFEPETFKKILKFIYEAALPEHFEEDAKDLYEVADYYELLRLKEICEQEVHSQLCLENAMEMYCWAFKFNVTALKKDAWDMVKR